MNYAWTDIFSYCFPISHSQTIRITVCYPTQWCYLCLGSFSSQSGLRSCSCLEAILIKLGIRKNQADKILFTHYKLWHKVCFLCCWRWLWVYRILIKDNDDLLEIHSVYNYVSGHFLNANLSLTVSLKHICNNHAIIRCMHQYAQATDYW